MIGLYADIFCEENRFHLQNKKPILACSKEEVEAHDQENEYVFQNMETKNASWEITRRRLDKAGSDRKATYQVLHLNQEEKGIASLLETADLKNGVDVATSDDDRTVWILAYGKSYVLADGEPDIATTLFECQLL